jgi:cyanoexosortase A
MLIKSNNPVPTSQKKSSFKDQNFLFLVILGLIFAIYLTVYWRFNKQDINEVFVLAVIYACFFFKFYQKQNEISFSSSLASRLTGLVLIFLPLFRAKLLLALLAEDGYVLVLPHISFSASLISIVGYIIFITGFKGIKKFQQELIFLCVTSILIRVIKALLTRILTDHNFLTVFSAKFATFFLWYLGFNPINEGSIIHMNGGSVDVYMGCTGWYLFFLLSQLSFCVLFLFRSYLKNIFLPFLLSFLISFILSIIRIIILSLVVKNDAAFHYWHEGDGSDYFTFGGMILFWGIIFLKLPNSLSFDLPSVNFRIRPHPFLLTVSVILGIIFSSLSLFFSPIAGINTIPPYKFPDQISLTNWQLIDSYPSSLTVKNLNPKVSSAQEENSETEDLGTILANQIYHYKNDNNLLTVKAHYIVDTSGSIKGYYKNFQELSQIKNNIEKQGKDGSSLYFINGKQSSLTACVNPQGKTTVTSPQFIRSLYISASSHMPFLNWLMGKAFLKDKRCLFLEASIDGRSPDRDEQLMAAWTELVSYWQKNFPPLRN